MPKPKELINKWFKPLQAVVSVVAPVWGVGLGIIDTIFIKPTKKAKTMINGNKTYIGIAVTVLAFIAKLLGYDVPIETTEGLTTSLNEIVMSVSSAIAAVGFAHKIEKLKK